MPAPMSKPYSAWVDPWLVAQQDPALMSSDMTEDVPPEDLAMMQGLESNGVPTGVPVGQSTPNQPAINPAATPADKTAYQASMAAAIQQANQKQQELVNQQQMGVDQLQRYADQYSKTTQQPDFSGLAALADAWGPDKTNLAAVYKPQQTPQEKAQAIFELQNKLQERKQDLTKSQYQNLQANIAAMKAQKDNALADELTKAKIGFYGSNNRQTLLDKAQDFAANKDIIHNIRSDKIGLQKLQQMYGIDNALKIVAEAPVVTQNIFDDAQLAFNGAMNSGRGASTGIGERMKQYMTSAGISTASIQQYLSGKSVPIPGGKDNPFVKALQGYAATERSNIQKQRENQIKANAGGYESNLKRNPAIRANIDQYIDSQLKLGVPDAYSNETPAIGQMIENNGAKYKFKGGDPHDDSNWEKQ